MADPTGTPIWFELNTPDPAAAQDFYAAVMDWRFTASPVPEHNGYRMGGPAEDRPVAGLMSFPDGGGVSGWLVYFNVPDVDAMGEEITRLGGAVRFGPMDIPHVGRFAVCTDPQNNRFTIMSSLNPDTPSVFAGGGNGSSIGHPVWIELATPDPDGAFAFYGALFDWTKQGAMPMGEMGEYAFIGHEGKPSIGAVMSSAATGAPARWNWYTHVRDIDAAIATATDRGGKLIQGPDQIPGGDYSANIVDPAGHQVGLVGPRAAAA